MDLMLPMLATDGSSLMLLGLSALVGGLLLRRASLKRRQLEGRDVALEVRSEAERSRRSGAAHVERLESRLHDYRREVEGRVETTMAVLDRLIEEAAGEIDRLETLLTESRRDGATGGLPASASASGGTGGSSASAGAGDALEHGWTSHPCHPPDVITFPRHDLAPRLRRMIAYLADAGYTADDIAALTERHPAEIVEILDERSHNSRRDAA
ncbi:MAG: hypothetical protein KY476_24465 [Planctomycetes bacterium]|nr:hypothetical protein [Planctomycetota bacterium]